MNSYGQNREDIIAQEYFGDFIGTILSIGENDGKTLSNSLALIELGWSSVLVEPSKKVFPLLKELHKDRGGIEFINVAVGANNCMTTFYESGTMLRQGDQSLVSSINQEETTKWKAGLNVEFEEYEVEVVDFKTLLSRCNLDKFDFVSIDIEGLEKDVVPQIDFIELGTKMCIIEWNLKDADLYDNHMAQFGLKLIHVNAENRIYAL